MRKFTAEDPNAVVERLTAVLNEVEGLELAGHPADVPQATQSIRELIPDVVILRAANTQRKRDYCARNHKETEATYEIA